MEDNKLLFNEKYFKLVSKSDGVVHARCQLCIPNKVFRANEGVSSNLVRHLKSAHKDHHSKYQESKSNSTPKKRKLEETGEPSASPSCKIQKTLHDFGHGKCNQAQATKLISEMVVSCSLPLSIVEKDSFKKMVAQLSGNTCHSISRKTLAKSINTQFDNFQFEVKEEVKKVDFCCTTADVWANKTRSFMGMTLHTIDPNTLKRKSYPIACERFRGRHTFDKCAEIIVNIHNQYDLGTEKVTKVLTDNGSKN